MTSTLGLRLVRCCGLDNTGVVHSWTQRSGIADVLQHIPKEVTKWQHTPPAHIREYVVGSHFKGTPRKLFRKLITTRRAVAWLIHTTHLRTYMHKLALAHACTSSQGQYL